MRTKRKISSCFIHIHNYYFELQIQTQLGNYLNLNGLATKQINNTFIVPLGDKYLNLMSVMAIAFQNPSELFDI